jgi:hypothetical protein
MDEDGWFWMSVLGCFRSVFVSVVMVGRGLVLVRLVRPSRLSSSALVVLGSLAGSFDFPFEL